MSSVAYQSDDKVWFHQSDQKKTRLVALLSAGCIVDDPRGGYVDGMGPVFGLLMGVLYPRRLAALASAIIGSIVIGAIGRDHQPAESGIAGGLAYILVSAIGRYVAWRNGRKRPR